MKINELCETAKKTQALLLKFNFSEDANIEELNIRFNKLKKDYYAHVVFSDGTEGYIREDGHVNVIMS